MSDPTAPDPRGEAWPTTGRQRVALVALVLCSLALMGPLWALSQQYGNNASDAHRVYYVAAWFDVLVLGVGWVACRRARTPQDKCVAALLSATCIGVISYWFSWAAKSYDYACYEHGAMAVEAGANPYQVDFGYPPPLAQALAGWQATLIWLTRWPPSVGWQCVYVTFEALQMGVLVVAVLLTHRVLRRVGVNPVPAAVCTSVAYMVNSPLRDTVLANQVNFLLLLALLLFLLGLPTRPVRAGLCLALASCLKPFLAPMLLVGGRRVRLGGVLLLGLLAVDLAWSPRSLALWQQYLEYMRTYPVERYWGNISPGNVAQMLGTAWHGPTTACSVAGYLVAGGFSGILVARLMRRLRTLRTSPSEELRRQLELGQVFDLLTMAMLFSPKVWYHHFVLFAPLLALVLATQHATRPGRCLVALALTQGVGNNVPFPLILHPWLGVALALSLLPVTGDGGSETGEMG